jgi:hypothetical protein
VDGLRLCVALGPLALYLLVLGAVNLSRRPLLVSGARDNAALGIGVSGMLLVGPVELLHPQTAVNELGWFIWMLSISMYALALSLVVLLSRPRLTIYNISLEEFRPLLAEVIESLDSEHRWAGSSLSLPKLSVQLYVDCNQLMRNVSLVAVGEQQSYTGWRRLEKALSRRLAPVRVAANVWGVTLALSAALLIAAMAIQMTFHGGEMANALRDMLKL